MTNALINLPTDSIRNRLDADLNHDIASYYEYLTQAKEPNFSLHTLSELATRILARLVLKDNASSEEAGKWLGNAAFAINYEFELCGYPKGEKVIEVILPSPPTNLQLPSTGVTADMYPSRWLDAYHLACIWWEPSFITQILGTIDDHQFLQSPTREPTYRHLQVEAAYALFRGDPETMIDRVTDALREIVKAMKTDEFAELIAYPEIILMDCIVTGNASKFNSELIKAIDSHIEYYSRDDSRRNDPKAWFCLPALGLTALAKRYKMEITVDSSYLPLELISKG